MRKARKITIPIPGTLDWELLRRFNIITHSQTFGEAAEKIGTSQPALLKQMDDLEEFLGKKLFMTTAKYRSMELTPDGKTLQTLTDQASDIFNKQIIKNIKKPLEYEKKKSIRIITTPGLAATILPDYIAEFISLHDNVRIELVSQIPPQKIEINEVHIRHDFLVQQNVKSEHIATLIINFYASRAYLEKYGIPNDYDDLIYHKVLAFKYFNMSSTDLYALIHDRTSYLEPSVHSDYIGFLVEMAYRDQGVIELPSIHPASKILEKISSIQPQTADIYATYLDIAEQDSITLDFIRFIKIKKKGNKNE
ncbi:MAG: hypothetical protein BGO67_05130 [Alphaproteobacteria bacterium 41-28]|nr:MAG: hypothetical protein BGO67_05130 [Alphaproteobacteria bacterium 41-28]